MRPDPRTSPALLACCLAAVCGCRPEVERVPLAVLASGDTAGWIVPCGCASNQSGGLPRRASYVADVRRRAEVVLVDVGGAACGESAYDRLRFEAVVRGEVAMGVAAHNLGAAEARLGAEFLRTTASTLHLPLISANVFDAAGKLVAPAYRMIDAGGRRVLVIGVLGEKFETHGLTIRSPRPAVLDMLGTVAGRYDTAVVLAYLPLDDLRQLAAAIPEIDLVVGGPTGQPAPPQRIGPVLLASATNKGKFLARFNALPGTGWQGRIVELGGQWPDDPGQVANVRWFYGELARRDFPAGETSFVRLLASGRPDYRLAGSASCAKCHAEDCRLWRDTAHARAWQSLQAKGAQVNPDCQRCHTTGYGLPGGFVSAGRSADRVEVGCESCHGPSQRHVADPSARTPFFGSAANQCIACHDAENSPQFAYDAYWAKIRHGETAASSATAVSAPRHEDQP